MEPGGGIVQLSQLAGIHSHGTTDVETSAYLRPPSHIVKDLVVQINHTMEVLQYLVLQNPATCAPTIQTQVMDSLQYLCRNALCLHNWHQLDFRYTVHHSPFTMLQSNTPALPLMVWGP